MKDGSMKNFKKDEDLEVGVDVPDHIAEDMLRCDYAIAKKGRPRIETKTVEVKKPIKKDISLDDIASDMDKEDLEAYARENLGIELDRRKGPKALHKEVIKAIKEKINE